MGNLTSKTCQPCEGIGECLSQEEAKKLLEEIPEWKIDDVSNGITRTWKFKDFKEALAFVNRVGELAENENHHPDIFLHNYRKVTITLWTHVIKGLSENDFIMAAKIDNLQDVSS